MTAPNPQPDRHRWLRQGARRLCTICRLVGELVSHDQVAREWWHHEGASDDYFGPLGKIPAACGEPLPRQPAPDLGGPRKRKPPAVWHALPTVTIRQEHFARAKALAGHRGIAVWVRQLVEQAVADE